MGCIKLFFIAGDVSLAILLMENRPYHKMDLEELDDLVENLSDTKQNLSDTKKHIALRDLNWYRYEKLYPINYS